MHASERVVSKAGGAWASSLNLYSDDDLGIVATQQIDNWVYVIGQDRFDIIRYELTAWTDGRTPDEHPVIECEDETTAWDLLKVLRQDCLVWQCGACDAWIHTTDRPRIGVLQCSTCRTGGVDFRHADRHVSP